MKLVIGVALGVVLLVIGLETVASLRSELGPSSVKANSAPTRRKESTPDVVLNPILTISVDDTISIQPAVRKTGIEVLNEQLPSLIKKQHFRAAQIIHFGEVGWITSKKDIPLPQFNDPCPEAEPSGDDSILRQQVEREKKRITAQCTEQRTTVEQDFEEQLSVALASIREALNTTPQQGAPCTAFYDMLANIALSDKPGLTIILSDAMETCGKATSAIPTPKPQVRVMLILLPSRYDLGAGKSAFTTFSKRKAMLSSIAPWLIVEPPNSENIGE